MRIKPWVLTAAVTVCAVAALGIIVAANEPQTTALPLRVLFWAALVLGLWGAAATLLSALGTDLARATWVAFVLAAGTLAVLLLWRAGLHDRRLLGGVILATLLLSLLVWRRLRHV